MRVLLLLTVIYGCGDSVEHEAPLPRGNAEVGGDVVSTVEGHPIERDSVASLAASARLDASEALARRQAEELLALEAFRRGYGERSIPKLRERQRLVQALLDRIADEEPLDSVSEEEVRTHYARRRADIASPERRAIRHIVIRVERDADEDRWGEAERLAHRVRGEWLTDEGTYERYRGLDVLESFQLQVEGSGLMTTGNIQPVLDAAIFRQASPGILPEAYRSSGGWHAIELVEIEPSVVPDLEDVFDRMRDELLDERRRNRLFALTEEVAERTEVQFDEVVADRALARELVR